MKRVLVAAVLVAAAMPVIAQSDAIVKREEARVAAIRAHDATRVRPHRRGRSGDYPRPRVAALFEDVRIRVYGDVAVMTQRGGDPRTAGQDDARVGEAPRRLEARGDDFDARVADAE